MKKMLGILGAVCFTAVVCGADSSVAGMTTSDRVLTQKLSLIKALPPEERGSVLILGDSMMRLLGTELEKEFASRPNVTAMSFSSLGSGLARQDSFDWPMKISELTQSKKPAVVIISLGANDRQALTSAAGEKLAPDTREWSAEYALRLGQIMDLLITSGVKHVIWLQLPDMKSEQNQRHATEVNRLVAEVAAKRPQVVLFETAPVLARKPGKFVSYVMGYDGAVITVRDPDGIHLSSDGAKRLAQAIVLAYWK